MYRRLFVRSTVCGLAAFLLVSANARGDDIGSSQDGSVGESEGMRAVTLDFGVSPDDNGNVWAKPPNTVITTQYVRDYGIVFGTAVDKNLPPVQIMNDAAVIPPCRSSGLPAFTADWWCQFRFGVAPKVPGALAGVDRFSAEVGYIDDPDGIPAIMEAYDNHNRLIDRVVSECCQPVQTLTVTAPAGRLISKVKVVSSADAAGLSVDMLDYTILYPKKVPAVSEWGLLALGLVLLAAITIRFGRRRFARTPV